ncbi:MAG TPA: hypothetical protein VG102_03270 [Candidatus Paceibacterota bacterium]|jgi:hypothetical protein|nr:hypothetical protein [Candidatus Paceibacterota bacterium]
MKKQRVLPRTAIVFLFFIGAIADGTKILLDLLFGIGFILDPLFVSPITTVIYWITMNHNGVPMFSGQNWAAAWINEVVALTPGIDGLPDWTAYNIYLAINNEIVNAAQGIIS